MSYRSYDLMNAYSNFCSFGGSRSGSSADGLNTADAMTNTHFAKLCKDTTMLDKVITSTEVDIVFNKFKTKGSRKLDFHTFNACIRYIAAKKYSDQSEDESYKSIVDLICKKTSGPVLNATLPNATGVFSKLTDSSQYTGVAGHRAIASNDTMNNAAQHRGSVGSDTKGSRGSVDGGTTVSGEKLTKSADKLAVFDRLTNTSNYTGASKARFDAEGNGKGLAGRDSPSKSGNAGQYRGGDVKDLSQILRS